MQCVSNRCDSRTPLCATVVRSSIRMDRGYLRRLQSMELTSQGRWDTGMLWKHAREEQHLDARH